MGIVSDCWVSFQVSLFPNLCECGREPLTEKLRELLDIFDAIDIGAHVAHGGFVMGRRRIDRRSVARAFVAKSVYGLATTELLIETLCLHSTLRKLCGFEKRRDVPSAATFSRVFAEFAETALGDRVLAAMVKIHVGGQIIGHASTDATEIDAREKGVAKPKAKPAAAKPAKKPGRPKKGEVREPPEPTRIETQFKETVEQAVAQLPKGCDWGTKTNSQGHKHTWKGYKTHIKWGDGNIPLCAITTSASVHDSQVAIPLIRMTPDVLIVYDLMDAAYRAAAIEKASHDAGHVPIIDPKPNNGAITWFSPAECERYKERTTAERGNSRLKDEFGARHVRVRGNAKVHMHVMFGLIALFADQILKPFAG